MILLSDCPQFLIKCIIQFNSYQKCVYFGKKTRLDKLLKESIGTLEFIDYSRELYRASERNSKEYIDLIDWISSVFERNLNWIFTVPAIKNPYQSDVFLNICYFNVLQELFARDEKIDLVIVDSPALLELIQTDLLRTENRSVLYYLIYFFYVVKKSFKSFIRFCQLIVEFLKIICATKIFLKRDIAQSFKTDKKIVLIRNYISEDFDPAHSGKFEEHFFPGLYDFLNKNDCFPVFLSAPTNIGDYNGVYRKVINAKRNIIFLPEILEIRDFFKAIFNALKSFSIIKTLKAFRNRRFVNLIVEDFYETFTTDGQFYAHLYYEVGDRLRKKNIVPEILVNWSEYQNFEKGLLSGFRKSFPNMKIINSQSMISPENHISLFPSKQDERYGILPDRQLVLGPVFRQQILKFLPELSVDYCPPLRYRDLLIPKTLRKASSKNILVLFGLNSSVIESSIEKLIGVGEELTNFKNIYIKVHPYSKFRFEKFKHKVKYKIPANIQFVNGKIDEYVDDETVGICCGTGASVELVMQGVPVIVLAELRTLTMNYLSFKRDEDMWQLCFSSADISEAIKRIRNLKSQDANIFVGKSKHFRESYFASNDILYWNNFLFNTNSK